MGLDNHANFDCYMHRINENEMGESENSKSDVSFSMRLKVRCPFVHVIQMQE